LNRRDLIRLLGGTAVAWPLAALSQTPAKVYRVGLLGLADNKTPYERPLIRGLARYGYALDTNLAIERRLRPQLVAELVASKVDLIIAVGYAAALAVKQGTTCQRWYSSRLRPAYARWRCGGMPTISR
jgi:putative ABC transport system substrate-binding protein